MTNWREVERIRKDPRGFRVLASGLVSVCADLLSEWEAAFLESVARRADNEAFTARQAEKLLEIRDGLKTTETAYGFSVSKLIKGCFLARHDLGDEDEVWISALHAQGIASIRVNQIGRLMRCARALNLVEREPA